MTSLLSLANAAVAAKEVLPEVDPLPLPAPPFLFLALLFLTFTLHMVVMNFTVGGTLMQVIAGFNNNPNLNKFSRWLTGFLPISMSFTVTLGIAPLLFVQVLYGQVFFTTSVLMGWIWLFLLVALMVAYYSLYYYQYNYETSPAVKRYAPLLALVLLIFIAITFVMNFKLFYMGDQWLEISRTSKGFFMNFSQAQVIPSIVHYLVGMTAFAGLLLYIHGWSRKNSDPGYAGWAARVGGLLFVVPTALQFLFGIWLLMVLPKGLITAFMMGDSYATFVLFAGMATAVLAIIVMLLAAVKRTYGILGFLAVLLPILIVAFMTMARAFVRDWIFMNPEATLNVFEDFEVSSQWFNIVLFAVLLVIGLATVGWMLYHVAKGKGSGESMEY